MNTLKKIYVKILNRLSIFLNNKLLSIDREGNQTSKPTEEIIRNAFSIIKNIGDINLLIILHDKLYQRISNVATINNNGVHPKHRILNYHQFFLDNIELGAIVLDLGCGDGFLTFDIAKKAQNVIGIDISPTKIKRAKNLFKKNNIKFINADAITYQFKKSFDYVVLSNVLEHIEERQEFLTKIKKFAKILLIRVPLINSSWLSVYKADISMEHMYKKGHFIEYTFETFQKEMQSAGLKILLYSIQFGEIWAKIIPIK